MKNIGFIVFAGMLWFATSCAQHKTCPTYTKDNVKQAKIASEKV